VRDKGAGAFVRGGHGEKRWRIGAPDMRGRRCQCCRVNFFSGVGTVRVKRRVGLQLTTGVGKNVMVSEKKHKRNLGTINEGISPKI